MTAHPANVVMFRLSKDNLDRAESKRWVLLASEGITDASNADLAASLREAAKELRQTGSISITYSITAAEMEEAARRLVSGGEQP